MDPLIKKCKPLQINPKIVLLARYTIAQHDAMIAEAKAKGESTHYLEGRQSAYIDMLWWVEHCLKSPSADVVFKWEEEK